MHKVHHLLDHPITQSQASVVFCPDHFKTIQHVNKHEIVFDNLNEEQIIDFYPIDGAMVQGGCWKLSMVCLHNNGIVASGILVT